jgi:hypothetical protein
MHSSTRFGACQGVPQVIGVSNFATAESLGPSTKKDASWCNNQKEMFSSAHPRSPTTAIFSEPWLRSRRVADLLDPPSAHKPAHV